MHNFEFALIKGANFVGISNLFSMTSYIRLLLGDLAGLDDSGNDKAAITRGLVARI